MGDFKIVPKGDGTISKHEIVISQKMKSPPSRKSELVAKAVEALAFMRPLKKEVAYIIGITEENNDYKINFLEDVSLISTENFVWTDVKPALHKARLESCTGVILAHNHPGGEVQNPSPNDESLTTRVEHYCRSPFLDKNWEKKRLRLYDHVIIMGNRKKLYFSFWEHKMLRPEEDVI